MKSVNKLNIFTKSFFKFLNLSVTNLCCKVYTALAPSVVYFFSHLHYFAAINTRITCYWLEVAIATVKGAVTQDTL